MNLKNDIRSVTAMKAEAASLLRRIARDRRPVIITQNGEPRGVLLDPESYEDMRNAIGLLKMIAQGEEDVRVGRTTAQAEVFAGLRSGLERRRARGRKKA